jgi:hypothetical protein
VLNEESILEILMEELDSKMPESFRRLTEFNCPECIGRAGLTLGMNPPDEPEKS